MNEQEILNKLLEQEKKIDEIYVSVEKTRKYFLMIVVISVVAFLIPLIGLLFVLPSFLGSYSDISNLGL